MKLHALTVIGFILMNLSFWPIFVALARRGGLHSSLSSMSAALEAFKSPAAGLETVILWGGPPLLFIGVVLSFSGVLMLDSKANSACTAACATQGFEHGRMRGNPHAEYPGETPRQCWCFNKDGAQETWAAEGIDLPTDP